MFKIVTTGSGGENIIDQIKSMKRFAVSSNEASVQEMNDVLFVVAPDSDPKLLHLAYQQAIGDGKRFRVVGPYVRFVPE